MFLRSIAHSVPSLCLTQEEVWEILSEETRVQKLPNRSRELAKKILLGNSGIQKRHFANEPNEKLFRMDGSELNQTFEKEAPRLAESALRNALEKAGLRANELDALFICTCTGYLCPGVSSHVAESLGMAPDIHLHDIAGLGCGAAIPSLRSASHFLTANPDATVAVVAVEICSSAFFLNEDPGVLISLCLFGDGASASIWSGQEKPDSQLRLSDFRSLHIPKQREKIRFVHRDGKLCNQLHRSVPKLAAEAVSELIPNEENAKLISHTGGRDVLDEIEAAFPNQDLKESRSILSQFGNMSSPSVLFALEEFLDSGSDHQQVSLTAFGAGFTCFSCNGER